MARRKPEPAAEPATEQPVEHPEPPEEILSAALPENDPRARAVLDQIAFRLWRTS